MANEKMYFRSWVKKGIGANIAEVDGLGAKCSSYVKERPYVRLTMELDSTRAADDVHVKSSEEKVISIVGPGDVLSISQSAVMNAYPPAEREKFPVSYLPYVEFWEPDFAWRYSPVAAAGEKLRPWLAVVACKTGEYHCEKNEHGVDVVTFNIQKKDEYEKIFPNPTDIWKSAHTQGVSAEKDNFCRIVALKRNNKFVFDEDTEYTAFLIPVFEVGRLRGIGASKKIIEETQAQVSAWESEYNAQKSNHTERPFTFPSYYSWTFRTGKESFETLVKSLKGYETPQSGITVDVTSLGEGMSYSVLDKKPKKKSIVMPSAMESVGSVPEPAFPSEEASSDESQLYGNLKNLLSMSPTFSENKALINGTGSVKDDVDDPVVVPPVYGGKHVMATSLDCIEETSSLGQTQKVATPSWFKQVNLDLHYRAAAGLGKKIVQEHQEEFVNRAWQQVELVKALNNELYQKLLSANVDQVLKNRTFNSLFEKDIVEDPANENQITPNEFVKNLMLTLESMQNTKAGNNITLGNYLSECGIPTAFTSTTFKNMVQKLSVKCPTVQLSSLIEGTLVNSPCVDRIKENAYFSYDRFYTVKDILSACCGRIVKDYPFLNVNELEHKWGITEYFPCKFTEKSSSDRNAEIRWIFTLSKDKRSFSTPSTIKKNVKNNMPSWLHIPKSRWNVYHELLNGTSYGAFLEGNYDKMPGYGFSSNASFGQGHDENDIGNVVSLCEEVYENLFGKEYLFTVVMAGGNTGSYLVFVNRDEVMRRRETDLLLKSYVRGYVNIDLSTDLFHEGKVSVDDLKNVENDSFRYLPHLSSGTFSTDSYDDLKLKIHELSKEGAFFGNFEDSALDEKLKGRGYNCFHLRQEEVINFKCAYLKDFPEGNFNERKFAIFAKKISRNSEKTEEYVFGFTSNDLLEKNAKLKSEVVQYGNIPSDVEDRIKKYLFQTPDYFEIYEDFLMDENYAQIIRTPEQWAQKIVDKYDLLLENPEKNKSALDKLNKSACLKNFMDYKKCLVNIEKELPKCSIVPAAISPDTEALINIQQEMLENTSLNESQNIVVDRVFSEFLGVNDPKEGEKLREKYLNDLLRSKYPIMAYPFFPEPSYYYLKQLSDSFILPCIDELPNNSVTIFQNNAAFIESFLCGMNTEMGRELLWREYPTDQRGSYFKKFWDSETSVEDIRNDNFYDVKSIHTWENDLGKNHESGKGNLILFAIKGDLMKNYPNTQIYLHKAVYKNGEFSLSDGTDDDVVVKPVSHAFFRDDIYVVGFKMSSAKLVGNPGSTSNSGYMLAFKQEVENIDFSMKGSSSSKESSALFAKDILVEPMIFARHVLTYL